MVFPVPISDVIKNCLNFFIDCDFKNLSDNRIDSSYVQLIFPEFF